MPHMLDVNDPTLVILLEQNPEISYSKTPGIVPGHFSQIALRRPSGNPFDRFPYTSLILTSKST